MAPEYPLEPDTFPTKVPLSRASHPFTRQHGRVRRFLNIISVTLLSSCTLVTSHAAQARICKTWSEAQNVGTLERTLLPEASGLAFSNLVPDRVYHINDSGNGPYFLYTDARGQNTHKVRIAGYDAGNSDFEAVSTAVVDGQNLLIVADIGDNSVKWQFYELLIFKERSDYGTEIAPIARVKIKYPNSVAHDAESLAVHPNGDIFILTKEQRLRRLQSFPSKMFRLPKAAWTAVLKSGDNKEPLALEPYGTLDLPALAPSLLGLLSTVTTDMSISGSGKRFLVLTYGSAFEFGFDLSSGPLPPTQSWKAGQNFKQIAVPSLEQQEGITYTPDGRGFLYSSEVRSSAQPLMKLECKD